MVSRSVLLRPKPHHRFFGGWVTSSSLADAFFSSRLNPSFSDGVRETTGRETRTWAIAGVSHSPRHRAKATYTLRKR